MNPRRKRLVAVVVMFCIASALAIFFSTLLGKAYLGMLKSGGAKATPKPPAVNENVKKVAASKAVGIAPVSVFYLQGGIYTDLEGARRAAEDFIQIGVEPYITGVAPYRIYIGFFGNRESAENLKNHLAEKELSVFIQSQVINAKMLTFSEAKEPLVQEWVPLMERCSMFLKDLGKGTDFGIFESADKESSAKNVQSLVGQLDSLIIDINAVLPQQGEFEDRAQGLVDSLEKIRDSMNSLQAEWNQHNYDAVAKGLMDFLQTYNECFNYLLEPDKT